MTLYSTMAKEWGEIAVIGGDVTMESDLRTDTVEKISMSEEYLLKRNKGESRIIALELKVNSGGSKLELITRIIDAIKALSKDKANKGNVEKALMQL